jgi:hypothetical protein
MPLDDTPTPGERARALDHLSDVRRLASRRRRIRAGVAAGAVVAVALAVGIPVALAGSSGRQTVDVVGRPPATSGPGTTTTVPVTTTVPTVPQTTMAPSTTVPATTVPPTTVPPTTVPPTTVATGPAGPGFDGARDQWEGDGLDQGSADQNIAVPIAVADLESGEQTDTGSTSGYQAAIAALQSYAQTPDAMVTPAQQATATADTNELNSFFGVTMGDDCQLGAGTPAASAWATEPAGTSSGVTVAGLQQAATDLRQQSGADACPAAVDDLVALESATPAQIAASPGSGNIPTVTGDEIAYLNALFQTNVLTTGS